MLVVACLSLSGCYVLQAATGQLQVMRHSKPIDKVLVDPATTRSHARGSGTGRRRASSSPRTELNLPSSRSYRRYADLGRPYVVWNVVATPEFSVEPRRWCFPVAGCVAYRGYFKESQARAHALQLFVRGDDVAVGGIATYSTLGHLPDPVFGSMLAWRETRLVGTIFHELAHEQLYFPGDSEFNEAFASVVEEEGVRRWLEKSGRPAELQAFLLAADQGSGVCGTPARVAQEPGAAVRLGPARRRDACREAARIRALEIRVRAVAQALGWLCRFRQLVCAFTQQCAPGVGRHVPRLHARPEARAG